MKTDVMIVGSGSSGISAAFELYEKGVPFVMLEKGDKVGGAGKFGAHGVFAVNSKQQQKLGVTYGYKEAFEDLTSYNHYFVNGELLSKFLKWSGENIDRLERMGLPVTVEKSEQKAHENDPLVYHKFNDFKAKMENWDQLAQKLNSGNNQVLLETEFKKANFKDGHLESVIVNTKDGELEIKAQKIIFADGGYCGDNELMRKKYTDADELLNLGEHKSTGVGIKTAQKLGADINHTPALFAHGCAPSYSINPMKRDSSVETLTNLPLLWIDKTGHRFVNEDVVYDFAMWANAAHYVGGKYYVVVDQKTLDYFRQNQVNLEDTFERQFCEVGQTPRDYVGPLENIQVDFDNCEKSGEVVKADSLTELADKINVPYAAMAKTIATYNGYVDEKTDQTFLKPVNELEFKVEEGPFYAIVEHCAILGTLDGVNVNSNCQPVREDGSVIDDIYIVGNEVNGLYSDGYPSYEGIANGFAFVSGWIAASHIESELN
jgi:fumarate reductase flavoprotein subunit